MLNTNKAQCIFTGSTPLTKQIPTDATIAFDNTSISLSAHVKNLGIIMDRYMNSELCCAHSHTMFKKVMGHLLYIDNAKNTFESGRVDRSQQSELLPPNIWHNLQHTATPNAVTTEFRCQDLWWWSVV